MDKLWLEGIKVCLFSWILVPNAQRWIFSLIVHSELRHWMTWVSLYFTESFNSVTPPPTPPRLCFQESQHKPKSFWKDLISLSFTVLNKQSGRWQRQRMLLNKSDQSLRLISMMKSHDLRGRVDPSPLETQRRLERGRSDVVVKTESNRRALMCMQFFTSSLNMKWKKRKMALTLTHTHLSVPQTAQELSEPTQVWNLVNKSDFSWLQKHC